jgi:O-antigen/teichoic acid export membrane protein
LNNSNNSKRIAKNSMMLYFRMIFTMAVSLYTSRVILDVLGVSEYGIYNVIGGVVMMFSAVNTTMATAVQRFMNFEMGRGNPQGLNAIFNTSVIIHLFIAIIVFVLLETVGVWFLNSKMNIDPSRMEAANWVLQFTILSFIVTILSAPYDAVIIANEHMHAFAIISIIEVLMKLFISFAIAWFDFDKLKLYAVLIFSVSVIMRIIYGSYSKKHFAEAKFKWEWHKKIFNEMLSFASWNLIGVSSTLIRVQGINIVINLFFGTIVNASMGIANQVKSAVDQFTNNFLMALNPQITKSYASGDNDYLFKLVFNGSKYAFYLVFFLTLPLIIETEYILKLWLKIVPEYTLIFVRLVLIISIIESLSKTLIQLMFANGNIRKYQIIVGSITILNLPISILFLYFGYQPQITLIISIFISLLALQVRLQMLKTMVSLPVKKYYSKVILIVVAVSLVSLIAPMFISFYMTPNLIRLIVNSFVCFFSIFGSIYFIGITKYERNIINNKIKAIVLKK